MNKPQYGTWHYSMELREKQLRFDLYVNELQNVRARELLLDWILNGLEMTETVVLRRNVVG